MKRFLLVLLASVALSAGMAAETHNFANYNIRYVNPNNGDTGDKHWSNRGKYVAEIVTDYDFDVVGMEEVTGRDNGNSVNPSTGRSQLEDLKAWLPDYNFLAWERSGNKDYSYNVLAYKKSRYECLDSGCFWLSPTPDTASGGWDPTPEYHNLWRTCGWAKLKVKETGEIFFFAVTHVNYGPSLDGRNSGKLISERLAGIAGDYPLVLVGDFNMRRDDHVEAYTNYAAHFYDAALSADENYCLPQSNPSTTVTGQNWYTVDDSRMSGSEFDYCFYRKMHALSRHIITENYGRSVNPSDHFPLLMRMELGEPGPTPTVHVSESAEAGGDGTAERPFSTLAEGVAAASVGAKILMTQGNYSVSLELPTSLEIIGGYSDDFSAVTGMSTIDGTGNSEPVLSVEKYYSLTLRNLEIKNYTSAKKLSDGAVRFGGCELVLDNVTMSGNTASSDGGAVYCAGFGLDICGCTFRGNEASYGGAVYGSIKQELSVVNTLFEGNSAKTGAAMDIADAMGVLVRNSAFVSNMGKNAGALNFDKCPSASHITVVNSTFALNSAETPSGLPNLVKVWGGAAIAASLDVDIPVNLGHLTVTGNTSTFKGSNKANYNGAAISVFGLGLVSLYNNILAGNYSEGACADLYLADTALAANSMCNIYTSASSVNIKTSNTDFTGADNAAGITAMTGLLHGSVSDGRFVPALSVVNDGDTPVVLPISTNFGSSAVNTLTSFKRMLESKFEMDLDGDGIISLALSIDQNYNQRAESSMPGSAEYFAENGVGEIRSDASASALQAVAPGVFRLAAGTNALLYNAAGRLIATFQPAEGYIDIDINPMAAGIYILSCGNQSYKIIK